MVVRPNFMKEDFETVNPADCVRGVMKDIGRTVSNGDWRHHILNEIYAKINERVVAWYYMKFMAKGVVERCEEGRKKKK